jgi:hypothetical protein
MIAACLFPEREQGKQETCINLIQVGVSRQGLSQARTVLALAPDLVLEVKTGELSLADAYKTAQEGGHDPPGRP